MLISFLLLIVYYNIKLYYNLITFSGLETHIASKNDKAASDFSFYDSIYIADFRKICASNPNIFEVGNELNRTFE